MNLPRRFFLVIIFGLAILLFGLVFHSYILHEIIYPISMVAWLFLRIFVLSIGQEYYWGLIVIVACVFLFRLIPKTENSNTTWETTEPSDTLKTIWYWNSMFTFTNYENQNNKNFKRELIRLLVSFYASQSSSSNNFKIFDELSRGVIPLPPNIHAYLFLEEPKQSKLSLKEILFSIRNILGIWVNRWTGWTKEKHYQKLNDILSFIETSLEIKNED